MPIVLMHHFRKPRKMVKHLKHISSPEFLWLLVGKTSIVKGMKILSHRMPETHVSLCSDFLSYLRLRVFPGTQQKKSHPHPKRFPP